MHFRTGDIVKSGPDTIFFASADSHTGTTTIASGTLIFYGPDQSTLGPGAIIDDAKFEFEHVSTTVANVISGTGEVDQILPGSIITLTANNTYTGPTGINYGTLALAGGGSIAASSVVNDRGTFDISATDNGATINALADGAPGRRGKHVRHGGAGQQNFDSVQCGTFSGDITGTGGLTLNGGTMVLAGDTHYAGTTTISNGSILYAGSGGTAGTVGLASTDQTGIEESQGSIIDNGTLGVDRFDVVYLGNAISGSGNFVQAGTGTTDLLGNNSYTGTTSILGGVLGIVGVPAPGFILNNAQLAFFGDAAGTVIPNTIAGTGTVFFEGNAIYTGADTDSGATVISGKLALSGTAWIGTSAYILDSGILDISATDQGVVIQGLRGNGNVILGNKILDIGPGSGGTFSGSISGAGTVFIAGATETLTGDNTFSGGLIVGTNTTVIIISPNNLGTGALNFLPGSTIKFAQSGAIYSQGAFFAAHAPIYDTGGNTITWAGQMSGPGDLAVAGGGTLILTNAANSYGGGTEVYGNTVLQVDADGELGAPAPLQLGDATTSGTLQLAGSFNLDPARGIVLNAGGGIIDSQGFDSTVNQAIAGAGGLTKAGSGVLTLAAANTYSGATAVNAGTLLVTGSIASSAVGVASGATLAAPARSAPPTVAGGGMLSPGNGGVGTLHVAGGLTLASGAVTAIDVTPAAADEVVVSGAASLGGTLALAPAAGAYAPGTDYKLISAASLTGTFSNVTGSFAGYTTKLVYSTTGVDLVLNYPFTNYATTPNQIAVATVLNVSAASSATANALGQVVGSNPGAVPGALAQLAGEIHAGIRSAAIEGDRLLHDIVLSHLRIATDGPTVWGSGFGDYGSIRGDADAAGLHHDTAGFIAGIDMPLGDGVRAGVAGAYTGQNVDIAARASRASGSSGHLIGYADWSDGRYAVRLGGDYGWGTDSITRRITALAQTNGDHQNEQVWQLYGDAGYTIAIDPAMVEPYIDIAHVSATSGRFLETGSDSALSGDAESDGETYSTIGLRAALNGVSLDGLTVTPRVDLGWQHAFETVLPSQRLAFVSTGQGFNVLGAPLADDVAALQVGLDVTLAPDAFLSLGYDGTFSSRVQDNAIRGTLSWKF